MVLQHIMQIFFLQILVLLLLLRPAIRYCVVINETIILAASLATNTLHALARKQHWYLPDIHIIAFLAGSTWKSSQVFSPSLFGIFGSFIINLGLHLFFVHLILQLKHIIISREYFWHLIYQALKANWMTPVVYFSLLCWKVVASICRLRGHFLSAFALSSIYSFLAKST